MTFARSRQETFEMGRVVSRAFGAIGRNLATFLILAVVLVGAPALILAYLQGLLTPGGVGQAARAVPRSPFSNLQPVALLFALVRWVCVTVLQAAIVQGVVADLNGRKTTVGEALATGLRLLLPLAAVGILYRLGAGLGLVLFVVPGLILATVWITAVPVIVVERSGVFAAFTRSRDLTRGSRWSIFGLLFVFWLLSIIVGLAVLAFTHALPFGNPNFVAAATSWPTQVVGACVQTVSALVSTAGVAAIYYELRAIKEGAAPSSLAAVFD